MKVALFGAGTMGRGIAQVFAAKGHTVLMYASTPASAQRHKDTLGKSLQKRVEKGKMAQEDMDALLANVQIPQTHEESADADLVIECVKEEMATKKELLQELDAFCRQWNADARQRYFVTMTVEDLGMAILQHGFEGRSDGYIQITAVALEEGVFELHLRDNAETFDPFSLEAQRGGAGEDPDLDAIGVLVIKRRAQSFFYRRYQGFNTLIVKI